MAARVSGRASGRSPAGDGRRPPGRHGNGLVASLHAPLAFPAEHQDVRPLAMGAARQVATAMGWSLPYTLGVLGRWKMAAVYCQAVLCYGQRIALDGSPAETVDAEAKDLATKQLAQLAARKAAKKAAEAAAPAVVKPKPAPEPPTPPKTPEQLRDRVRASLLRRHA
jgi:sRNA-binding protein